MISQLRGRVCGITTRRLMNELPGSDYGMRLKDWADDMRKGQIVV